MEIDASISVTSIGVLPKGTFTPPPTYYYLTPDGFFYRTPDGFRYIVP